MNQFHDLIESTRPIKKSGGLRFSLLIAVLWIAGGLLLSRSFYLQIVNGATFRERAEYNRVAPQIIPAPRGIIYDKHDVQLVENVSSTDVILDPTLLPKEEDEGYLIEKIPALLPDVSADVLHEAMKKARKTQRSVVIAKAIDHETVLNIQEQEQSLQGVRLASSLVRKYPFKNSAAHVLGYTSSVTADELDKNEGLLPTDITGKRGIEQVYDAKLRGKHGIAYTEVNAAGKAQVDLGKQDPVAGEDLHLTIDMELQNFIYSLFSERDAKKEKEADEHVAGSAVVINPNNGEIVAMVSYPAFDPNVFSQPGLSKDAPELFSNPQQPLFNRGIEGTYASGSVIKPFLAAAGLQEGIITEQTTFLSTGGVTIGPWHFADWKAGGHGVTDVKKAIAESVNTFFYLLTGGDETHKGLGVIKAAEYLRAFGWDEKTGVDLPSEAAGFLPYPEWKEKTLKENWYIGDTYHFGIGQGNILVTPLQVAAGTAAIANGQYWYQPHILSAFDTQKKELPVSSANINIVKAGMRQTVLSGSGRSLQTLPINLAGKTGTAQIGGTDKTHAWFTSFGPYEKPELVVTVLLEKGGDGDKDALPFAREIWQWIIEKKIGSIDPENTSIEQP